jgi:hypothetical protein
MDDPAVEIVCTASKLQSSIVDADA